MTVFFEKHENWHLVLENQLAMVKEKKAELARRGKIKFNYVHSAQQLLWKGKRYSRRKQALYQGLFWDCIRHVRMNELSIYQGCVNLNGTDFWVGMRVVDSGGRRGKGIFYQVTVMSLLDYYLLDEEQELFQSKERKKI